MSPTAKMHFSTEKPVLFVEEDNIIKIDPRKPENLFGMWSVFAKASGIMENGKRLENMSWRLWQQQTLCPRTKRKPRSSAASSTRPQIESLSQPQNSIPALSSSVDSRCSSDVDQDSCSHPSCTHRNAICAMSENGVTSLDLQNLLLSIREKQDLTRPISPLPSSPITKSTQEHIVVQETAPTPRTTSPRPTTVDSSTSTIESVPTDTLYLSPTNASETSVESASDSSTHSVVRGFKPGGVSTYRSQSQLAPSPTPILKQSYEETTVNVPRTKGGVFHLGGSSGEEDNSIGDRMSYRSRGSSLRTVHEGSAGSKKQTSFVDQVTEIAPKKRFIFADDEDTAAIESASEDEEDGDDDDQADEEEEEEEEISESAIDDDDEAWEDDGELEEQPKLTFARVDSKPELVSRRSLLTANLHQGQRASAMANAAARSTPLLRRSRTSTPNGPSMPASPTEDSPMRFSENMTSGDEKPDNSSDSQPINMAPSTSNIHPPLPPMSPRAARRNMVSQELGVSLRKAMLNERQYKNLYANNTNIRRAHTSTDMRRLDATNSQPSIQSEDTTDFYPTSRKDKHNSWNDDFDHDPSDYHRKGW